MRDQEVQDIADFLKALGEFNRLSLVYRLCQCQVPQNAMCLCDCCSVDASVVSRHLKVLAENGIVEAERNGRQRIYSLNRDEVASRLRALADRIEAADSESTTYSALEPISFAENISTIQLTEQP